MTPSSPPTVSTLRANNMDFDFRPGARPDYPVRFDLRLVEEAVLARARDLSPELSARFHHERDRIYETTDPDEREAAFRQLHGRWFQRLGLVTPFHRALGERPTLLSETGQCRIFPAISRRQEHADLLAAPQPGPGRGDGDRCVVLRVRTESLLHAEELLGFLRRELLHVADMLDADFGYCRELPDSDLGPSFENLLLARYRVLWDTAIDGRLLRAGLLDAGARELRRREFCRSFRMLGDRVDEQFQRWFTCRQPRHEEMVAFSRDPRAFGAQEPEGWPGWCPICRLPSAEPRVDPGRVSWEAIREIREAHPGWKVEDGICPQCADLYQARQGVADRPSAGG